MEKWIIVEGEDENVYVHSTKKGAIEDIANLLSEGTSLKDIAAYRGVKVEICDISCELREYS